VRQKFILAAAKSLLRQIAARGKVKDAALLEIQCQAFLKLLAMMPEVDMNRELRSDISRLKMATGLVN
jgi:hypothetical protein